MTRKPKIMLDAGHGGEDSGAVGPNGRCEKDVALAVTLLLGSMLITDFDVAYTRKTDVFVPLSKRALIANDWQADAFLSIHCNSGPVGQGSGFEVFTTLGETASDPFATDLFQSYGAQFPSLARRMDMRDGDPDKEADFAVLRLTRMRSALFELEFIHTVAGEAWLTQPANQAKAAMALAAGTRKHFGLGIWNPGTDARDGMTERPPLEIEALAGVNRLENRLCGALANYRKELETLFRQP